MQSNRKEEPSEKEIRLNSRHEPDRRMRRLRRLCGLWFVLSNIRLSTTMTMTTIITRTTTITFPGKNTEVMKDVGCTKREAEAVGNAAVIWNAEATKAALSRRRSASRGKSITMSMKDIARPNISLSGIHSK